MSKDVEQRGDRTACTRALRSLLWRSLDSALQPAVEKQLSEIERLIAAGGAPIEAFQRVYSATRAEAVRKLVAREGSPARREKTQRLLAEFLPDQPALDGPDFHCDAGLGGLARLLRAAGYDAAFWPGIDDDELLQTVLAGDAILLTNDTTLMRRGVITRGVVPALLVPIALDKRGQFEHVVHRLDLPLCSPRCMACGGRLLAVEKESVRDRIPPRTYPWRDDYFLCERCGKLFWQGTHWEKIRRCLQDVARSKSPHER
jgi:uncharacterized protein with PIN domain